MATIMESNVFNLFLLNDTLWTNRIFLVNSELDVNNENYYIRYLKSLKLYKHILCLKHINNR
jgi:hypothetical protein